MISVHAEPRQGLVHGSSSLGTDSHSDPREKTGLGLDGGEVDGADSASSSDSEELEYPDGGRGWLIVFGAVSIGFATFGFVNAWGVFQSYYTTHLLKDSSPSNIAWIGSIQYSLVFGPGFIGGRLLDIGHFRIPMLTGSLILVVAIALVAECTEYWHFLLCQGIGVGLGAGICFGPAAPIVGHWFLKRRGLAFGITAAGSSLGGSVYPIIARQLINAVGFQWTMRILALISFTALAAANLTLRPRLPPKNLPGGFLNFKVFKSAVFSIYCSSLFISFLGIYTVLTYIDVGAVQAGISPDFSFYLISIANMSSAPGRILTGVVADRVGPVNVIVPMSCMAAIMTFAWPYAVSKGSLIAVAILYGFASSAFVSAFSMPIYKMGEMGDIGRRLGTTMIFTAVGGLCGPPISGAIKGPSGDLKFMSYYAGSAILVGVALMLTTKRLVLGTVWGKF
ncbi:hypothetical protein M413DRAFT_78188 [Hebeloma cylindrosporum]|uniref:Major facilitator superfamily (MFS) profile domain-containing protein n=1 Tax=Hebeloma cylindrosporum TaxID=76867 RepID=A0A0C3BYD7_HEBCY|nr:hypothetical protein M413DRAFT_78188 [Hebeloma cylindrosporum h7]